MLFRCRDNGWRSQPRDPATGRFQRRSEYAPREEGIRLRLTSPERLLIEQASAKAGKTMTEWIMDACRAAAGRMR